MVPRILDENTTEWNNFMEKFINFFTDYGFPFLPKIILQTINDNGAIIAGGALVKGIDQNQNPNHRIRDIDIYVNLANSQKFIYELIGILNIYPKSHVAPVYDKSFMVRNNILGRLVFFKKFRLPRGREYSLPFIEIMLVKDGIELTDVVNNFDLSFCKIWTDGKNIYTNHLEDLERKEGTLGKDYVKALLEGNMFTINRMKKYTKVGYTIKFEPVDIENVKMVNYNKVVRSPEEWCVNFMLKNLSRIISSLLKKYEIKISFDSYALSVLTKSNSSNIYNIKSFRELVDKIYEKSYQEPDDDEEIFNRNTVIYSLIMAYGTNVMINNNKICDWKSFRTVREYFKSIGIRMEGDMETTSGEPNCSDGKGFDGENVDFTSEDTLVNLTNVTKDHLINIFKEQYPNLISRTDMLRYQQQIAAEAARKAQAEGTEIEEATGTIITSTGQVIPARCFSVMEAGDTNAADWETDDPNNIMLLVEFEDGSNTLVCTDKTEIEWALNDIKQVLYRCGSKRGIIINQFVNNISNLPRGVRYQYDQGQRAYNILDQTIDDVDTLPSGIRYDISMRDSIDRSVKYVPFTYGFAGNSPMKGYLTDKDIQKLLLIIQNRSTPVVSVKFKNTIPFTVDLQLADHIFGDGENLQEATLGANHCQHGSTIMLFELIVPDGIEIRDEPQFNDSDSESDSGSVSDATTQIYNSDDDE